MDTSQRSESAASSHLPHWKIVSGLLILYDVIAVNFSYFFALWFRFDCQFQAIPSDFLNYWLYFAPIYTVLCLAVFYLLHLYRSMWRFASVIELSRVIIASILMSAVHFIGISVFFGRMPLAYHGMGALLQIMLLAGIRFSYRLYLSFVSYTRVRSTQQRVMLVGAGAAGQIILRDIERAHELNEKVACIIDDNPNKWGRYIDNVPIVGGRDEILVSAEKFNIDKIYVAIPSATAEERRDILNICKETGCELKNLPGVYQLLLGTVTVDSLKEVDVVDLLGREPIKVNLDEIFSYLRGKTILVTGGGGSIGSELCRQIASHAPKRLIVFDISENYAHQIGLELRDTYPDLDLRVEIGSIRDSRRINSIFQKYRPNVVYHAAAHKHVPLMEDSPCEAIKNNTIGTYKTAYAAMLNGCERFVLISTDKAVNPTNIMGASKRLCEMVIQTYAHKIAEGKAFQLPPLHLHMEDGDGSMLHLSQARISPKTEFVAVRFGNVLGSNGSVIPRFKEQIARGGPVTVTHPDIIRYFMTIPEAVSLVLQAGLYAKGGEIFVLDMGTPVKIDTLARNLIKLSGLRPDVDIRVEYTGLRPGEKLYEEKLMAEEGLQRTANHMIHIAKPIPLDDDLFIGQIQDLMEAAYEERGDIKELVASVVATYQPEELEELTDTHLYSVAKKRQEAGVKDAELVIA